MKKIGKGEGRKGVRERGEAASRMWSLRDPVVSEDLCSSTQSYL